MNLKNKLGLEGIAFQQEEERISKQKARKLFEDHMLDTFEVGTYAGLQAIHRWLFEDVYEFAGQTRTLNIAKGHFRFASALYLGDALERISAMPQKTFEQIVAKYIEMNIAHPFLEGNGRSTRIWLDAILRKELGKVVDWSRIDRDDYMAAMERSPVRDTEIRLLLESALTDKTEDRTVFMHSIDASYRYEGYSHYKTENV
jgi:cell filamentation protein